MPLLFACSNVKFSHVEPTYRLLLLFFSIHFFFKTLFHACDQNINNLDPDQAKHFVGPDLVHTVSKD